MSGSNAAFTDIGNQILARAPWFLLYIIGITFLVMAMAFRSLVIAIKAALTTLASAVVGFGVLTLVVQLGHGMGIIGLDRTGPIESFVPPIAFAILFGLSMDYEVFLMSRIREEHVHGNDDLRLALADGIAGVGRVIVAAALIMSSVFFSFTARARSRLEGVRPPARHRHPDRRADRAHDARPGAAHDARRALVVDPRLARQVLPNLTIEPPADRDAGRRARARAGDGRNLSSLGPGPARRAGPGPASYSFTYGRPSAAGGTERPTRPTSAISVNT